MKHKPSISNEQVVIKHLREDPEFAAEYPKAAIEDTEEPKALLLAQVPQFGVGKRKSG